MTMAELLELLKKARKQLKKYHVPKDEQTVTLSIDTLETALSEQPTAVWPKQHVELRDCCSPWLEYSCGDCNGSIMVGFKYCPHCGKPIKWK